MKNDTVKRPGNFLVRLKEYAAALSPYLLLELFVPGGTVLAFLLFLHRRKAGRVHVQEKRATIESPMRDQRAAQPVVAMAACCVILVFMLAA
jgi:hypothetical protein